MLLATAFTLACHAQDVAPAPAVALTVSVEPADPALQTRLRAQLLGKVLLQPEQFGDWVGERITEQTKRLLDAQGYLNAQVQTRLDLTTPSIAVQIVPGPPTRIASVNLQVNSPVGKDSAGNGVTTRATADLPSEAELRSLLLDPLTNPALLRVGEVFTAQNWEKFKAESLVLVQKRVFLNASIEFSDALLDAGSNSAQVVLTINTGPVVRIGQIRLLGLKRYPVQKVTELHGLTQGDLYDAERLSRAQLNLLDSRWFSSVTLTTQSSEDVIAATPASRETVAIDISLAERASQRLTLGLGYNTDLGARAKFAFEDTSIGPTAWSASAALTVTQKLQNIELGLKTAPSALGIVYGVTSKYERQRINSEGVNTTGISIYRSRRGETIETVSSLSWQRERQTIAGSSSERLHALVPAWSWNQRILDDRINPRKGFTVNAQVSGGAENVGSSTNFVRGYLRGLWLRPLGQGIDAPGLSLRGEIGSVNTPNANLVPSENLFRTGGGQSVRGYSYQSLGKTEFSADGSTSAIVGTQRLLTASAELRIPATRIAPESPTQLDLAVFYDAGAAAPRFSQMKLAQGYGAGLRWRSAVGPINLDLAYGQLTKRFHLHFSVGFTF